MVDDCRSGYGSVYTYQTSGAFSVFVSVLTNDRGIAIKNAELAFRAGCNGLWLISQSNTFILFFSLVYNIYIYIYIYITEKIYISGAFNYNL